MTRGEKTILVGFGSLLIGVPIAMAINILTEYFFIIETEYCYEYRFPKIAWLLDFFYDGYHYDTNLFNLLLTFAAGCYLANRLIKFILKPILFF